ncbi:MAG: carboxypeptidase regulatory-like domain-containing protein [Acidobacteria bacterium]|nr:carboxypeptidase regulatory-like domain-containing protein [Acidobacteriota bacterium]
MKRISVLFLVVFLFAFTSITSAQFSITKQSKAVFSGQLLDAKTNAPLVEAQVVVRTQYSDFKTKTDSTGNFIFEVDDKEGLKNFVLLANHPDYREKDVLGVLRQAFSDGKAKFSLQGLGNTSQAFLKHKKQEFGLTCGRNGQISKDGRIVTGFLECLQNERIFTISFGGDDFTLRGKNDVSVEVNEDKAKIECVREEPVEIAVKVLMYKR